MKAVNRMNKKQLEKWQEIYSLAMMIGEYSPWEIINEKTAFIYFAKDGKHAYIFKILGNTFGNCGIACYPGFDEYISAHRLMLENPKNEPAMYMQTAIYGLWDCRENVSADNKKLLKELGLKCRGDGSWLHFEKYDERQLPRMLTDDEAEAFADALGNFYMMLKAVFENNLPVDFENGEAVMRKYAGNNTWHNGAVPWELFEEELSSYVIINNTPHIKKIKKMLTQSYSVEIDERCLKNPICDDRTGVMCFPVLITVVDAKNGYIYSMSLIEHTKSIEEGLFDSISNICFKYGKPDTIKTNDNEVVKRIEDFCDKTGIKLKYQNKKLSHIEEVLGDMFDCFSFCDKKDSDRSKAETYYISVSLMKGIYRHIKISGNATLEQLHEAIVYSFEFDDDHAHAFFLNNKIWSNNGYYSKYIDERNHTCDYSIRQVLSVKQQFVYVFDFGDEWRFNCKVLKIANESCNETEIVRSVGASPKQYPDYDEDMFS